MQGNRAGAMMTVQVRRAGGLDQGGGTAEEVRKGSNSGKR